MWKYYKTFHLRIPGDPLHVKAFALFRVNGVQVERYEGLRGGSSTT